MARVPTRAQISDISLYKVRRFVGRRMAKRDSAIVSTRSRGHTRRSILQRHYSSLNTWIKTHKATNVDSGITFVASRARRLEPTRSHSHGSRLITLFAIACACGATPPNATTRGVPSTSMASHDSGTGERLVASIGHQSTIFEILATPDGTHIVTLAEDRIARVISTDGMREIARFYQPGQQAFHVAITADASRIAVAYESVTIVYDVASGVELGRIPSNSTASKRALGIPGADSCLVFDGVDLLLWRSGLVRWRLGSATIQLSSAMSGCWRMGFVSKSMLVVDTAPKLFYGEVSENAWRSLPGPSSDASVRFGSGLVAWSSNDGVYTWRVGDPVSKLLASASRGDVGFIDQSVIVHTVRGKSTTRLDVSTGAASAFEYHELVASLGTGKAATADGNTTCTVDSSGVRSTCLVSTTGSVRSLAVSESGELIVGAAGTPLRAWSLRGLHTYAPTRSSSPGWEGTVALAFDVAAQVADDGITVRSLSGGTDRELRHQGNATYNGVAMSPNGAIITTTWQQSIVRFGANGVGHDVLSNILPRKPLQPRWAQEHGDPDAWISRWGSTEHRVMAYRDDGAVLAVTAYDKVVLVRDDRVVALLDHGGVPVTAIAFRPGTTELAVGFADGTETSWDTDAPTNTIRQRKVDAAVSALAFDPTGASLLIADDSARIRLYPADDEGATLTIDTHLTTALALVFLPNARIASGHVDGGVRIWKVATSNLQAELFPLGDSDWLVVSGDHFETARADESRVYGVRRGRIGLVTMMRRGGLLAAAFGN